MRYQEIGHARIFQLRSTSRYFLYRVRQFLRQLTPVPDRQTESALRALLEPEQWELVARLSRADRTHLLAVHQELVRQGWRDRDLLLAALLHDVGKADETVRVGISHRVAKVLLGRISPALLDRLGREDDGWLRHGIYLTVHHPALGAEMARRSGVSERACWLIAHHDDGTITTDAALNALREIDAEG